jgi:hypothetical protein
MTGIQVNTTIRCGFCTLDLDADGEPVIAYHGYDTGTTNYIYVWNSTGEHALPGYPMGVTDMAWPHVCVDTRDWIHVVCATNPTNKIYYSRSQDGGSTWIDWIEVVTLGTSSGVCQTIVSDLSTGKVAIGYTKPVTTSYLNSDVYYVESIDGTTWNFASPVNITNFGTAGHPMSDETRAYCDCNLLYDGNGDLHVVYTTIPYPYQADIGGMIWHWSQATGHRKVTGTFTETSWIEFHDPGAWRYPIDHPHISEDADNVLYCQWGQCTTPGDVSAGGYGNWDVYCTYSTDGGVNWMAPVNVTGTATPGAAAGQCMSENWANMAKVATDVLHVQYVFDLDAGGCPIPEGVPTLNPVFYQPVPVDSIMTDMVVSLYPDTVIMPIPPGGGSFDYTATITNNSLFTVYFDGWLMVELPTGPEVELLSRTDLFMPSGGSLSRNLTMSVPGIAPAGWYTATLYLGDYGWNIWAEGSLVFQKQASDASAGGSWACSGWDEVVEPVTSIPESHLLANVYPNPFNPATVISYQLTDVRHVNLFVYDVTGNLVTKLVDGWRTAGIHEVTFDASDLPSGVYIYSLEAGSAHTAGKLVLMK